MFFIGEAGKGTSLESELGKETLHNCYRPNLVSSTSLPWDHSWPKWKLHHIALLVIFCNSQEVEKWYKCVFLGIDSETKIIVCWLLHAKLAYSVLCGSDLNSHGIRGSVLVHCILNIRVVTFKLLLGLDKNGYRQWFSGQQQRHHLTYELKMRNANHWPYPEPLGNLSSPCGRWDKLMPELGHTKVWEPLS